MTVKKTLRIYFPLRMLLCVCTCILITAVLLSVLPRGGEETLPDRFIRLHVLANSDSAEDQALKLQVRDAVLRCFGEQYAQTETKEEAEEVLRMLLPQIEKAAAQTVHAAGYAYCCHASVTKERYPARTYGEVTLPAGEYCSLRVTIGEAAGHNWWCVLFPPLCLSAAATYEPLPDSGMPKGVYTTAADPEELLLSAGFTPREVALLTDGEQLPTVVKFKLVEILRKWLSRS